MVQEFTNKHLPVLTCPDLNHLISSYVQFTQTDAVMAKAVTIIHLDFAAPGSRNALLLKHLPTAMMNCCRALGSSRSVVLAMHASRPKEETTEDPVADEYSFVTGMRKAGFLSIKYYQPLTPPASETGSLSTWDFMATGRLFYLQEDDSAPDDKHWLKKTELFRTGLCPGATLESDLLRVGDGASRLNVRQSNNSVTVTLRCEQHSIHLEADEGMEPVRAAANTRAAQRGPQSIPAPKVVSGCRLLVGKSYY